MARLTFVRAARACGPEADLAMSSAKRGRTSDEAGPSRQVESFLAEEVARRI